MLWLMVPAGAITDSTVTRADAAACPRAIHSSTAAIRTTGTRSGAPQALGARQIHYVDSGTSGGVWGLAEGYSLMIGGDAAVVERLRPIFETLAPAPDKGWGRVGAVGSGHYTKMVHNGIEYGLMQAYAEGFSILQHKSEFKLDLHQIAEIWRYGSVVRSWLLDLTADALGKNPTLHGIAPYVADSGEGRWTVADAIELGVPAWVITASLLERLRSQRGRLLFGQAAVGHAQSIRRARDQRGIAGRSALWLLTAAPSFDFNSLNTIVDTIVHRTEQPQREV